MFGSVPAVDVPDDAGYASYEEDDRQTGPSGRRSWDESVRVDAGQDARPPRLCVASKQSSLGVVRNLIESGEDVNAKDETPPVLFLSNIHAPLAPVNSCGQWVELSYANSRNSLGSNSSTVTVACGNTLGLRPFTGQYTQATRQSCPCWSMRAVTLTPELIGSAFSPSHPHPNVEMTASEYVISVQIRPVPTVFPYTCGLQCGRGSGASNSSSWKGCWVCHSLNPACKRVQGKLTPLHLAVDNGDVSMLHYLLQHKANVDLPDEDGATPLHWATQFTIRPIVEALLAAGADPNRPDLVRSPINFAPMPHQLPPLILNTCHPPDSPTTPPVFTPQDRQVVSHLRQRAS
eukprot:1189801-Prorocentrum_minimum.AAC.2